MSAVDEEARAFVRENRELLVSVLRYSEDSYARACALVLLSRGGTERELDEVRADLDRVA